MRVIDKTGKVYRCIAWYPIHDPEAKQVYLPGESVKVDENPWIKLQAVMVEQPVIAEKPAPKTKTPTSAA